MTGAIRMIAGFGQRGLATALVLGLLAGCSSSDEPRLMNLKKTGAGPDEFAILPTKQLQAPTNFSELPAPTPGGSNRTDPTPKADAIAALGGDPSRLSGGGVNDAALIGHTTRFGTDPAIRAQLASLDLQFRKDNDGRLLERLFNVSVYFKAYRKYELDQYSELERFRAAGVRTPAVPPDAKTTKR